MSAGLRRALRGWTGLILLTCAACASAAPLAPDAATVVDSPEAATPSPVPTLAVSATEPAAATPTPAATATPDLVRGGACLPGTWVLADPHGYMEKSMAAAGNPAELVAVEGDLVYRFSQAGEMEIRYTEFAVVLNAAVEGGSLATRSTLDGSAAAAYTLDSDMALSLSRFSGEGVRLVIAVDEQVLLESTLPAWAAFFSALAGAPQADSAQADAPQTVRAAFDCTGDRLALRGEGKPVDMILERSAE